MNRWLVRIFHPLADRLVVGVVRFWMDMIGKQVRKVHIAPPASFQVRKTATYLFRSSEAIIE